MLVHNQAIKELSPADYLVNENKHKSLEKYLRDLLDACGCSKLDKTPNCQTCDHEKQASCQGRLHSFLFHITDLAAKHFDHEEIIMLSRPHVTEKYEYFRNHHQTHADILQKLHALDDECLSLRNKGNPPEIYRQFNEKISDLFVEHDRNFDDPFLQSTKT